MQTITRRDTRPFKKVVSDMVMNISMSVLVIFSQVAAVSVLLLALGLGYALWLVGPIVAVTFGQAVVLHRSAADGVWFGLALTYSVCLGAACLHVLIASLVLTYQSAVRQIRDGLVVDIRDRSDDSLFLYGYARVVLRNYRRWLPWEAIPRFIKTRQLPFQTRPK